MPAFAAQIDSSPRNAPKSVGPPCSPRRARSRDHGPTGDGHATDVARSAVEARKARLLEELAPSTALGEILVERIAVLSVRLERSVRFDEASTSKRVREAGDAFDDARAASIAFDARALMSFSRGRHKMVDLPEGASARATHRRLCRSADGIDALVRMWGKVRAEVAACTPGQKAPGAFLPPIDPDTFDFLEGSEPCPHAPSPIRALALRVNAGDFDARRDLLGTIDLAVARLERLKGEIDPADLAAERSEAAELALFDPSGESLLARKQETNAERGLFRALAELRRAEPPISPAEDPEATPDAPAKPKGPRPTLTIADPDAPSFVDVGSSRPGPDNTDPANLHSDRGLEADDDRDGLAEVRAELIALELLGREGFDETQIYERELARVEAGLPVLDRSVCG